MVTHMMVGSLLDKYACGEEFTMESIGSSLLAQVNCDLCLATLRPRVHTTSKATGPNPKDIVGSTKVAMSLFPPVAQIHAADAIMDGAGKYGPYNWRAKKILCTTYLYAALRHIAAYWEGEDCADDSKAKHLGHAMASLAIVVDAEAHGCLIDDRPDSDNGKVLREAMEKVAANEKWRQEQRALKK